ncbi:hypothetical protein NE865_01884 [Phthorimaea operculella]|nr:hypothetical protein NE865_01884 [Phthorimaea operculella]
MLIFNCGIVVFPSTYILSLCFQVAKQTDSLDIGLAFLYIASGVIAGKILYDRYQQIHILGSLTPNPNVTSFANKIASCSACLLTVGFLIYLYLFLFKVDDHCLTALSIFIYSFSTLYIWTQCIITTYLSTLYFDQQLTSFRQFLANASLLLLIVMAIFGIITSFLPKVRYTCVYFDQQLASMCQFLANASLLLLIVMAIFGIVTSFLPKVLGQRELATAYSDVMAIFGIVTSFLPKGE